MDKMGIIKEKLLEWLNTSDPWEQVVININDSSYKYDWYQAKQIYLGLQAGVDVSIYSNPEFSYTQMREIKDGLINGVDATLYADPKLTVDEMYRIRDRLEDGTSPEYSYY